MKCLEFLSPSRSSIAASFLANPDSIGSGVFDVVVRLLLIDVPRIWERGMPSLLVDEIDSMEEDFFGRSIDSH